MWAFHNVFDKYENKIVNFGNLLALILVTMVSKGAQGL
jgi:hypothetical protein